MKTPVSEKYLEWKNNWIEKLRLDGDYRGFQFQYYGTIIFNNFEQKYPNHATLKVTDQFIQLVWECISQLMSQNQGEFDEATLKSINNPVFLQFMQTLKDSNLLMDVEIKRIAPHIAQSFRTSPDSVFQNFHKDFFLAEIAHQLEPDLTKEEAAVKMREEIQFSQKKFEDFQLNRPFSFKKDEISFTPVDGTHVNIFPSVAFKEWLFNHKMGKPVQYTNGWTIFKKDDHTIMFNKGIGTQGIVITKRENNFFVCNNLKADDSSKKSVGEMNEERKLNLQNSLMQLYSMGCKKPELYPVVEESNTNENCLIM